MRNETKTETTRCDCFVPNPGSRAASWRATPAIRPLRPGSARQGPCR
jgi:hypothetical protein